MPNPFVHAELATTNVRKAKAFYEKMFKWKLNATKSAVPGVGYTMIDPGKVADGTGGGIMAQCQPDAPSAWMPYVQVDDIQTATKKAKKLGAIVCKDVTEVPGMGWLSIIRDPTGAMIGLWEASGNECDSNLKH
jgi:predicted enzyme related to lactoylglutathione lyase